MIKLTEYEPNSNVYFSLKMMTPWDDDGRPYNIVNIALFKKSWWFRVPEIIKPFKLWRKFSDTSFEPTAQDMDGDESNGYFIDIRRSYGITFAEEGLFIDYGVQPGVWSSRSDTFSDKSKMYWYPWHPHLIRHDLLKPDGSLYHRNHSSKVRDSVYWYQVLDKLKQQFPNQEIDSPLTETVKITHITSSGSKQHATITLTGEEREWRPKWTRYLPFNKHTQRTVNCSSDIELGEKAGSWKGGLMGWSCEWRHGESMTDAFYRWYSTWDRV